MTYAKGHYNSMYGRIESGWKINGDSCYYHFVVPANTTATLYLGAVSVNGAREGMKPLILLKGIKYVGLDNGKYAFKLQPGNYNIRLPHR